jgi:MFS family permease
MPRAVWILQTGLVFNALGNGAAAPFVLLYLHDVRGIPLGVAGLVSATSACAALLSALAGGAVADRLGPKVTLLAGLLVASGAFACYPLVREAWHAFVVAAAAGSGGGVWLTGQSSLLAAVTPPDRRHTAFARQRVAANLGLGLGGLAGGLLVTTARPSTFTLLFVGNAATFLVYAVFVAAVPAGRPPGAAGPRGYRAVLADGVFIRFAALNLAFVAAAVALLNSLFPVFAKNQAGLRESAIGLLFLVNTAAIVLAQLPVARSQEGRRRMRAFAVMGCLFAAWLLVLFGGQAPQRAAFPVLAGAVLVFAGAECIYDVVQGPLVADLAPEGLTGRYMAVMGLAWQLGFIVGPAAGGFLLAAAPHAFWLVPASICLAGGGYSLLLERRIPPRYRRTPRLASTRRDRADRTAPAAARGDQGPARVGP